MKFSIKKWNKTTNSIRVSIHTTRYRRTPAEGKAKNKAAFFKCLFTTIKLEANDLGIEEV